MLYVCSSASSNRQTDTGIYFTLHTTNEVYAVINPWWKKIKKCPSQRCVPNFHIRQHYPLSSTFYTFSIIRTLCAYPYSEIGQSELWGPRQCLAPLLFTVPSHFPSEIPTICTSDVSNLTCFRHEKSLPKIGLIFRFYSTGWYRTLCTGSHSHRKLHTVCRSM